jgi:3-oxoacyl-[acyl-carrier protein] reductase
MDLGIAGKRALVCGASAGLGYACASALLAEGANVTIVARNATNLAAAVTQLRALGGGEVGSVCADVATHSGRDSIFHYQSDYDIVVTNAGGPPPGDFRQWQREDWLGALESNMLAPIDLIKRSVDGMMERGFGRILNITSSAVKAPVDGLGLSNGARSGLTGFVAGLARTTVGRGVTINNLLPGTFDTARLASNFKAQAQRDAKAVEDVIASRLQKHPAHRFGRPEEFGAMCAFLCSQYAGYLNGQSILLDGGSFPGVM